jgi:hypothetical protein
VRYHESPHVMVRKIVSRLLLSCRYALLSRTIMAVIPGKVPWNFPTFHEASITAPSSRHGWGATPFAHLHQTVVFGRTMFGITKAASRTPAVPSGTGSHEWVQGIRRKRRRPVRITGLGASRPDRWATGSAIFPSCRANRKHGTRSPRAKSPKD